MGVYIKTMDWMKDAFINRHLAQWAFYINRLTGILIAIYLIPHIIINSIAMLYGPEAYSNLLAALDTPIFKALEVLLITGVTFHMINGIRILLVDFFKLSRKQNALLIWVFLLTIIVFVGSLIWYWPYITGSVQH